MAKVFFFPGFLMNTSLQQQNATVPLGRCHVTPSSCWRFGLFSSLVQQWLQIRNKCHPHSPAFDFSYLPLPLKISFFPELMTVMPNVILHVGNSGPIQSKELEIFTSLGSLLLCTEMTRIHTKKEEGGVLQMLSFISGSEIQLHIFTIGTCDLHGWYRL